jgi:hypothetical protein
VIEDDAFRSTCRANVAAAAPEFSWSKVLQPLTEFCRHPHRAPDLMDEDQAAMLRLQVGVPAHGGLIADVKLGARYLREGGPRLLAERVKVRLRRLLSQRRRN